MSDQPLRVLLVDDEMSLREPLAKFLREKHSYTVDTAADGEQAAIRMAESGGRYDVALIDDLLPPSAKEEPRPFGLELLKRIKSQYSQTEVIIFTGWGMERALEALRAGAFRYLAKPFNLEELAITLQHAAEYQRLKGDAREKQILAQLMETSTVPLSTQDQKEVLDRILHGIQAIGFDRARLYLLTDNGESLVGRAHVGMNERFVGVKWSIADDCHMQQIITDHLSHVFKREGGKPIHSEEFLDKDGVDEWACVPLILRGKVIGKVSVDNKHSRRPIVAQELTPIALFASQAAATIELSEQKDQLARLITSSPNGIIAVNPQGNVTRFNNRAEEILGYRASEVLGKPVENLYDDSEEPRKIGKKLHESSNGRISNYETAVKSKEGEVIPILHSVTWLYDANGERSGSVGFFEDLRSLRETQRRLEFLLNANNIVARADNMGDGLQSLATMIVALLNTSFCRIFLLDESEQYLVAKAAAPPAGDGLDWKIGLEDRTAIAEWEGLSDTLNKGVPIVLRNGGRRSQPVLEEWSRRLELKEDLQSLLVIPLRTKNRVVGLLDLGELKSLAEAPFSEEKTELAAAIGDQIALLVDHLRLHEITNRRRHLLEALDAASQQIRAEKEPAKLLQEVVRLAAELVGCTAGCLYINHRGLEELELRASHGFPTELIPSRLRHADGVLGSVAQAGQSRIVNERTYWPGRQAILSPLKDADEVAAILLVADNIGREQFTEIDLEILERFAMRAFLTLQASRLFAQLGILHKISDYIQATGDLDKIFHVVLTGITAGYGLGFNRAAAFLLDERRENLIGKMGIGCLDRHEAERNWKAHLENGLEDFEAYRKKLEQGTLPPTPVGERIRGLRLPVEATGSDVFSRVMLAPQGILFLTQDDKAGLPAGFIEAFDPALPLVAVPLLAKNQAIGIIVADTKFTQAPITPEGVESLQTFANTAATAIDNVRLLQQNRIGREKLQSLFEASQALVSNQEPHQVLKNIVEQTRVAANASWVRVILINEQGQPWKQITGGTSKQFDLQDSIRANGISMQVMSTGKAEVIEDTNKQRERVSSFVLEQRIMAALCFPFSLQGKSIGVMWINYDELRHFPEFEIAALQLYVNHAAIAYEGARRVEELEQLSQAAQAMSKVSDLKQTLQTIIKQAVEMFKADFSTIWSYDVGRNQFLPDELMAVGYSEKQLQRFREIEPSPEGATYKALQEGWIGVHDVSSLEYPFLRKDMRELLKQSGVASFQNVALRVGNEPIGVLYVSYKQPHTFGEEDRRSMENFAAHAALSLGNAKLLDQVSRAKTTAKVVAGVIALEESLDATLDSIVNGTLEAVRCDAVVLYAYDQPKDRWNYPPTHKGVWHPQEAWPNDIIPPTSIVREILGREAPYIAERVVEDKLLEGRRFPQVEKIDSCVAIPLHAASNSVGVMFVNYRTQHRFTAEELSSIELFASQASVAIRNAQLHEQVQKRAKVLQALYETGKDLTSTLDLDEILSRIAVQAWAISGCQDTQTGFCGTGLVEESTARLVATYPPDELVKARETLGEEGYLQGEVGGRIGIVGRAIQTGESQRVGDVTKDHDYWEHYRDIRSELVVLIKIGGKVIGVINVEHPDHNAFDEEDQQSLEALAAQASIAIQNASSFKEMEKIKGFVGSHTAVEWMRMVSTSWGHSIRREVGTALGHIALLHPFSGKMGEALGHVSWLQGLTGEERTTQEIQTELEKLETVIKSIGEIPIIAPLSHEDAVDLVQINDLVKTYLDRKWKHNSYKPVLLHFYPQEGLDDIVTIRASRAWLRQAFEILADNAVQAMQDADSSQKSLTVTTRRVGEEVEISIKDTGPGIPDAIYERLFKKPIDKPPGSRGAGIGLMLAQTIVQTYQGSICVRSRGNDGTDMVIALPCQLRGAIG